MTQALEEGLLSAQSQVELAEGDSSRTPKQKVTVRLGLAHPSTELECVVRRGQDLLTFRASIASGLLSEAFSWALGVTDPEDLSKSGVHVHGAAHNFGAPESDVAFPFQSSDRFLHEGALVVGVEELIHLRASMAESVAVRAAPELPLQILGKASDADDFELVPEFASAGAVDFGGRGTEGGHIFRVRGNLFVGRPGRTLKISARESTVVIYVDGNLYLAGDLAMVGASDRLFFIVGNKPEGFSSGRPDAATEHRGPREGEGKIYLGSAGTALRIQASLISTGDCLLRTSRARVIGSLLVGGRLHGWEKSSKDDLEVTLDSRFRHPRLPVGGLPIHPGTEAIRSIHHLRLVETGPHIDR